MFLSGEPGPAREALVPDIRYHFGTYCIPASMQVEEGFAALMAVGHQPFGGDAAAVECERIYGSGYLGQAVFFTTS